ncbi:Cupin domain-containing protein [Dyadobacter soli]|uniref:Cupin domain-containing protein n=1 Tax=Dyadobacter soli TaxID=659014 RepID=A0A1G6VLN8_9BACT|nr:cupin domain-containing protein [Dyadobacter soli]SDD54454.1 Cupin domain-containing protein [Dyadobacter soli]
MKTIATILVTFLISNYAIGQHSGASHGATAPELIYKKKLDMPGLEGKEVRMGIVTYAPGEVSPPHRHPIAIFGYVLEGEIEITFEGEKTIKKKGDPFYEQPEGLHNGTRNLSKTKPAKLLVYFLGDEGKPLLVLEPK